MISDDIDTLNSGPSGPSLENNGEQTGGYGQQPGRGSGSSYTPGYGQMVGPQYGPSFGQPNGPGYGFGLFGNPFLSNGLAMYPFPAYTLPPWYFLAPYRPWPSTIPSIPFYAFGIPSMTWRPYTVSDWSPYSNALWTPYHHF